MHFILSTRSHTLTHSHPHSDTNHYVKQTAALCLLRLLLVNPRLIAIDQHAARIVQLLNDRHFGVVTSACSLLEGLAHINFVGFMDCVSIAVLKLSKVRGWCVTVWGVHLYIPCVCAIILYAYLYMYSMRLTFLFKLPHTLTPSPCTDRIVQCYWSSRIHILLCPRPLANGESNETTVVFWYPR